MAFVKLDTGILNSTLWFERDPRVVFITALLMAVPWELTEPLAQLEVRSLNETGFIVPPGWYGFIPAAGVGIVRTAMVEREIGLDALEKLGSPDSESRTPDFDGRRLVRVDGGYLVLNFIKYRDKDATTADRSRRWRERQKEKDRMATRVTDTATRVIRHQAEAEAEAEADKKEERSLLRSESAPRRSKQASGTRLPENWRPNDAGRSFAADRGMDPDSTAEAFADYWTANNGRTSIKRDWNAAFRTWCRRAYTDREMGKGSARTVQPARGHDAYFEQLAIIASRNRVDDDDKGT